MVKEKENELDDMFGGALQESVPDMKQAPPSYTRAASIELGQIDVKAPESER